jgi:hypothetical protein
MQLAVGYTVNHKDTGMGVDDGSGCPGRAYGVFRALGSSPHFKRIWRYQATRICASVRITATNSAL